MATTRLPTRRVLVALAAAPGIVWTIAFMVEGKAAATAYSFLLLVAPAAAPLAFWSRERGLRIAAAEILSFGYGTADVLLPAVLLLTAAGLRRR